MPAPRVYVALAITDAALTACGGPRARKARRVTKPALMPALALWLHAQAGEHEPSLRRRTLAALGLSCVGDVALLGEDDDAFRAGVGAFLGAHLAYLAAFHERRADLWRRDEVGRHARAVAPVATVWAVAVPLLASRAGALRGPVSVYGTVLAAMQAATLLLDDDVPADARRRLVTGAGVFLTSDALLGARRFLLPDRARRSSRVLDVAVMATYTTAQWLLADGIARLTRRPGRAPAQRS